MSRIVTDIVDAVRSTAWTRTAAVTIDGVTYHLDLEYDSAFGYTGHWVSDMLEPVAPPVDVSGNFYAEFERMMRDREASR